MHGLEFDLAEANEIARKLREELDRGPASAAPAAAQTRAAPFAGPAVNAPDLVRQPGEDRSHRPSWTGVEGMLNEEHAGVYEATKDLPGWQDPADSQKLYEIAYHSGAIILEIGVYGGRSAVVELRKRCAR